MTVHIEENRAEEENGFVENVKTIAIALVIALLIRIFLFQPFNIPSGSMIPTLLVGDYLFVSKYDYGLSRHSFPFSLPPFHGRIFASPPDRGDVAVFKLPSDGHTDYIKRVIGLPGDKIEVRHGVLIINDKPVPRVRMADFVDEHGNVVQRYRETLPNGVSYNVLDEGYQPREDDFGPVTVPPGNYFMMGDNRDNSNDSRLDVGFVPFENFVGKADLIFFSTNGKAAFWQIWKWPEATRWGRFFSRVQ